MAIMMIIPLVGFILVMVAILTAVKKRSENGLDDRDPRSTTHALRILDERFAKGEIDEMEYIRKKEMLKH
jgi:putative membrane protein